MIEEDRSTAPVLPWHGGREILLATISELGLPRRLQNALRARDCSLAGQLIQFSEEDLLSIPAMGVKTIMDAKRVLARYSLDFGTVLDWDQAAAIEARGYLREQVKSQLAAKPEMNPERRSDFLLATLEEAGFPQRFINYLPKHGCELVGQLVQWTEDRLYRLSNLGSRSIADARALLGRYDLTFGMELPDWDDASAFARREAFEHQHEQRPQLLLLQRKEAHSVAEPTVSPEVPEEILLATLEEMGLPKRMVNHLPAEGCELIGQLIQKSEAELFCLPNLGRKSVYQARKTLASYGLSFGLVVPGWNDQSAMVRRAALGDLIRQALFGVQNEGCDADRVLEDEARQIFQSVEKSDRNVDILMSLLGFDGLPPKTLETVGSAHGLTRERVRQISDRARLRFGLKWHPTPSFDEARRLLIESEPTGASGFSELLAQRGIARGSVHPTAVTEFAEFIGKRIDIRRCTIGSNEVYCSAGSEALVRDCARELRRATSAMGCTSLDRLAVVVGVPLEETKRIKDILEMLSETVWLGSTQTWAMSSRPTRNRVANLAEKIFAVTESITTPELRRCLSRSHRLATFPAGDALSDLLELKGIASSDGDFVRRLREISTDCLGSIELPFLLAFREHGSPLSREQLEDICVDQYDVHPTSFWIYLSYSPIITKLAPGVYSLAGDDVSPGAVENLRLRAKAAHVSTEHGWTQNGELWCVTQLDRNNVRSGNRAIPAYVARLTEGGWSCNVSGGLPAGMVAVEHGFARGLVLAFKLAGAENGDLARFTFDLQRRSVEVRVGGSELTENAAVGPGYYEEVEDDQELDIDLDEDPSLESAQ